MFILPIITAAYCE